MRRLAEALLLLAVAVPAAAQVTPVFTAPLVEPPPATPVAPPPAPVTPERIVGWFQQACVLPAAKAGAAVDWALANGFEPVDPMRGDVSGLLEGQAGSVLAAPDAGGRVMLVAVDGRCSVWAEQEEGPPLRQALAAMVGTLTAKGAKARIEVERNLERSGAWRSQVQWRYRAVGTVDDLGIGAVTTLANAPGTQVLRVTPLAAPPGISPDGQPLR